jgi:hypothetical protein
MRKSPIILVIAIIAAILAAGCSSTPSGDGTPMPTGTVAFDGLALHATVSFQSLSSFP